MALDALEVHTFMTRPIHESTEAMAAINEYLAKPEPEPVAWALQLPNEPLPRQIWIVETGFDTAMTRWPEAYKGAYKLPLYTKDQL